MDAKEFLAEKGVFNLDTKKRYNEVISWMEEYAVLRQTPVIVRSEKSPCSHCGYPLKEHSKDSKLCPDRMKNFQQGN